MKLKTLKKRINFSLINTWSEIDKDFFEITPFKLEFGYEIGYYSFSFMFMNFGFYFSYKNKAYMKMARGWSKTLKKLMEE